MATKELDMGDKHLLRLCRNGADPDGWAPVSDVVYPLVSKLPTELIELRRLDGRWQAKLTEAGNNVVDWL